MGKIRMSKDLGANEAIDMSDFSSVDYPRRVVYAVPRGVMPLDYVCDMFGTDVMRENGAEYGISDDDVTEAFDIEFTGEEV